jgi:hypothetical protein
MRSHSCLLTFTFRLLCACSIQFSGGLQLVLPPTSPTASRGASSALLDFGSGPIPVWFNSGLVQFESGLIQVWPNSGLV